MDIYLPHTLIPSSLGFRVEGLETLINGTPKSPDGVNYGTGVLIETLINGTLGEPRTTGLFPLKRQIESPTV